MSIRRSRVAALAFALAAASGCGDQRAPVAERAAEPELMPQGAELDPALEPFLPPGATFEQARLGHRLFTVCTVCHGPDAEGTQLGPSFADGEWIHVEADAQQIARVIRDGVSQPRQYPVPMPPQGGGDFDDEELHALAVYILLVANRGGAG
jgi:mono/diheme cytochrome c family protein